MASNIIPAGESPANSVVPLPTAAAGPVFNHRRPGSYGRKIVSFQSARVRRARRESEEVERRRAEKQAQGDVLNFLLQVSEGALRTRATGAIVILKGQSGDQVYCGGGFEGRPEVMQESIEAALWLLTGGDE